MSLRRLALRSAFGAALVLAAVCAIAKAATAPDLIKRMDDLALDLVASTPDQLAQFQHAEIKRWS